LPYVLLLLAALGAPPAPLAAASITMPAAGDAVVTLTLHDAQLPAVTALDVAVDGEVRSTVLVFGQIGHPAYTALLHALPAGKHAVVVQPSPYWPWPWGVTSPAMTVAQAPQSDVLGRAPALWVRADTVGTTSDLPLLMYAEDMRRNGSGVLRYSVIFSNEDGGTATPALLARWGRTTDIEMMYEEEWRDGRMVAARYQAPDHKVIEYKGAREGDHPSLVDATLNNVFLDRGRSAVRVMMVPVVADLQSATRESVMDTEAWTYRRMADELQEEGKAAVYGDVREYLYVDAKLTLEDAAVAAIAKGSDGVWRSSDRGMKELAVDRNGWVRIAIPASRNATDLGFQCYPTKGAPGHCRVDVSRIIALDDAYKPSVRQGSGTLDLNTGEMRAAASQRPQ
jgi:hypothetical protein